MRQRTIGGRRGGRLDVLVASLPLPLSPSESPSLPWPPPESRLSSPRNAAGRSSDTGTGSEPDRGPQSYRE